MNTQEFSIILLILLVCILFINRYFFEKKIKIEEQKKERKRLFESLSTPKIKTVQEGSSIILTLIVPSPEFFYEMNLHEK